MTSCSSPTVMARFSVPNEPNEKRERTHRWLKRFHIARIVFWSANVPLALATGLKNSTPYLVVISLAALIEGAFASYMGSRAAESPPGGV